MIRGGLWGQTYSGLCLISNFKENWASRLRMLVWSPAEHGVEDRKASNKSGRSLRISYSYYWLNVAGTEQKSRKWIAHNVSVDRFASIVEHVRVNTDRIARAARSAALFLDSPRPSW